MFLNHAPQPVRLGVVGRPLHHDHCATQGRDADDHPGAHHPSDVRDPEEDVSGLQVEAVPDLLGGLGQDAYVGVDGTLGLAGGAARVEDHGPVLAVKLTSLELLRLSVQEVGPVDIHLVVPRRPATEPVEHHDPAEAGDHRHCLVSLLLQLHDLPPTHVAVGRQEELRPRVLQAGRRGLGREAAEDGDRQGAHLPAGEHDGDDLRDHGHVDADGVSRFDAFGHHRIGEAVGLEVVVPVRGLPDGSIVSLPDAGDLVLVHPKGSPVEAIVGDVDLAPREPQGPRIAPASIQDA